MLSPGATMSRDETEEWLLKEAVPIPEGYTHFSLCIARTGPSVYIAAEGYPAMVWDPMTRQWRPATPLPRNG